MKKKSLVLIIAALLIVVIIETTLLLGKAKSSLPSEIEPDSTPIVEVIVQSDEPIVEATVQSDEQPTETAVQSDELIAETAVQSNEPIPEVTVQSTDYPVQKTIPGGTIVFASKVEKSESHTEYYVMNGDGNRISSVGYYTGSTAWSPDNTKLAVGCENIDQLCILDMTNVSNTRSFPMVIHVYRPEVIEKIDLPAECVENLIVPFGVPSISWSRDGKSLAVVCRISPYSDRHNGKVCLLDLAGNHHECWPDEVGAQVHKLAYSPVEDIFAAVIGGRIYLADMQGNVIKELAIGINPAWSPDGMYIAFSTFKDGGPTNGIAIMDRDGNNQHWLYVQPDAGEWEEFINLMGQQFDGRNGGRISWSPDGRYIVFSGNYLGYSNFIFRADRMTGEIIILADNQLYDYVGDPNWGALEIE